VLASEFALHSQWYTVFIAIYSYGILNSLPQVSLHFIILYSGLFVNRYDTHLQAGDVVNLLLTGDGHSANSLDLQGLDVVIDDGQGQIIVNPDLLLSGTTVVSGVFCLRK
jgi:hypothetical protein